MKRGRPRRYHNNRVQQACLTKSIRLIWYKFGTGHNKNVTLDEADLVVSGCTCRPRGLQPTNFLLMAILDVKSHDSLTETFFWVEAGRRVQSLTAQHTQDNKILSSLYACIKRKEAFVCGNICA